jgi:hypothetical protein
VRAPALQAGAAPLPRAIAACASRLTAAALPQQRNVSASARVRALAAAAEPAAAASAHTRLPGAGPSAEWAAGALLRSRPPLPLGLAGGCHWSEETAVPGMSHDEDCQQWRGSTVGANLVG